MTKQTPDNIADAIKLDMLKESTDKKMPGLLQLAFVLHASKKDERGRREILAIEMPEASLRGHQTLATDDHLFMKNNAMGISEAIAIEVLKKVDEARNAGVPGVPAVPMGAAVVIASEAVIDSALQLVEFLITEKLITTPEMQEKVSTLKVALMQAGQLIVSQAPGITGEGAKIVNDDSHRTAESNVSES